MTRADHDPAIESQQDSPGQSSATTLSQRAQQAESIYQQGMREYRAGQLPHASVLCRRALELHPTAATWHLLAIIAHRQQDSVEGLAHIDAALRLAPQQAELHAHRSELLRAVGKAAEAVAAARAAIALNDAQPAAYNNLGLALAETGDTDEAEACFRLVVERWPGYARGHYNLGHRLYQRGQLTEAADCFRDALRHQPVYVAALVSLGVALHGLQRPTEALPYFDQALRLAPQHPGAWMNRGNLLLDLDQTKAAEECFRKALSLRADYVEALIGLALIQERRGQHQDAERILTDVIRRDPGRHEAHYNLGNLHYSRHQVELAIACFEETLRLRQDFAAAAGNLARCRAEVCDWHNRSQELGALYEIVQAELAKGNASPVTSSSIHAFPWSPQDKLAIAERAAEFIVRKTDFESGGIRFAHTPHRGERLKVGYLSAHFRNHAGAHLMRSFLGLHDRQRFEVFAYSIGPDDQSSYRRAICEQSDHFKDMQLLSHADAGRVIYDDHIDLLVDLMGYAGGGRPEILALRPAPIQIRYLGFPGTVGSGLADYFVTDHVATPAELSGAFAERLIVMPHSYQVNDFQQAIADEKPTRAACGLPPEGFVFCGFNNNFKIEPEIFDVWMSLLRQVPDSVLWLTKTAQGTVANLRREAADRGVDPQRLVFADIIDKSLHLARHQLADLFLDTVVCNGHTTASDALWAGVPVVTCIGQDFAQRVAASLLTAIGLPDLIVGNLSEYEKLVLVLATDRDRLRSVRQRLAAQRTKYPLFDTPRFVRNMEQAYHLAWRAYLAGERPGRIIVEDSSPICAI